MFTIINKNTIRVANLIFTIEDGEDYSTLGYIFGDGTPETMFVHTDTVKSFVGRCFHVMQQCGGRLVDLLGEEVRAVHHDHTSGGPINLDTPVWYGDVIRPLSEIVNV